MRQSRYIPADNADVDTLADFAFRCGAELRASDKRANWIDDYQKTDPDLYQDLVDAYHAGQEERYATEDW